MFFYLFIFPSLHLIRKINCPFPQIRNGTLATADLGNSPSDWHKANLTVFYVMPKLETLLHVVLWNSGWLFDVNENLNVHLPSSNGYPALKINHSQSLLEDELLIRNQHYTVHFEFFGLVFQ